MAPRNQSMPREIGSSGLSWARGGTIEEELHPKLAGRQAMKVYRDMSDNDPLINAIMYAIDMLVRQVDWTVDRGDANEEDAEFLESCMDDMSHSWSDFISEIMSMLRYGFSFHEIVYKRRLGFQPEGRRGSRQLPTSKHNDRRIGWRKLASRAQESLDRWELDEEDGGLIAFVQKAPPKYEEKVIPIRKGLLFRTSTYKNNPEGRSLLRGAYRPWYYKTRIESIEGTGIERDLAGFPVFHLPAAYLDPNATDDEKAIVAAFESIGKNLRRDRQEFLLMPRLYDADGNSMFELELMSSSGTRTFNTTEIIQRYDQRIAMTVLADFILLGHEKVGSFALSDNKTDLFAVALGTILDHVQDVVNRFAVTRLWEVNGLNTEAMPQITHGDIEDPDLDVLGNFLSTLAGLGMTLFPDDDLEAKLREVAHLPELSEEVKEERERNGRESDSANAQGGPGGQQDQQQGEQDGQQQQDNPFADLIDRRGEQGEQ